VEYTSAVASVPTTVDDSVIFHLLGSQRHFSIYVYFGRVPDVEFNVVLDVEFGTFASEICVSRLFCSIFRESFHAQALDGRNLRAGRDAVVRAWKQQ